MILLASVFAAPAIAFSQEPASKNQSPITKNREAAAELFRPEAGKFPPLELAKSYRGEVVFVDHANRRGSVRVQSPGAFRFNGPHPFAMLPYGVVQYHGAPADLRDVPLGTVLHLHAFLPPDPKLSAVPVFAVDQKKSGSTPLSAPPQNHVLLLEDEPSRCLREGMVWKLKEVEVKNYEGTIVARREPKGRAAEAAVEETLTFDAATRIWRGREYLRVEHFIAEGLWPANGRKSLGDHAVQLGITWKPTAGGVYTRFHISDLWLDDVAMQHATQRQMDVHQAFIRSRWMPGWIDAVEYGKFGRATVTATLFGGMAPALYADFKKGTSALMNAAETTLKHTEGGTAGPTQMAARGKLLDVLKLPTPAPLGSSGIQIKFETDLITEGLRPTRIIRVRPTSWPDVHLPREEYIGGGNVEERFPSPTIFPKY